MSKEAMISPEETVSYQTGWDGSKPVFTDGWRVAQVVEYGQTFPMADPIFWVLCAENVEADTWFYVNETQQIIPVPPIPFPPA